MGLSSVLTQLKQLTCYQSVGYVDSIVGSVVKVNGLSNTVSIGTLCELYTRENKIIKLEVVGFSHTATLFMAYKPLENVGQQCKVTYIGSCAEIFP